jgi:UDP-N-acetylglucosamine 2-epimerase
VKHAPVSRALRRVFREFVVHTGQHYDDEMSRLFFDELGLPEPDRHLGVGSGTHAEQTGQVAERVEALVEEVRPDCVLVFGDTNSTLGAALAVAKLRVPLGHVEAGVRSGLGDNPEEQNRILVDHASDLLFVPTPAGVEHLRREGAHGAIHLVGDVMRDALVHHLERTANHPHPAAPLGLGAGSYLLLTIHRAENTDRPEPLIAILDGLEAIAEPVIFPVHPRTREALARHGLAHRLESLRHVHALAPVGYLSMLLLERDARLVITDSGGVPKEAFLLGTPCLTLFARTPWPETVAAGWNRLVPLDGAEIAAAVREFAPKSARPDLYGDGHASERIVAILEQALGPGA